MSQTLRIYANDGTQLIVTAFVGKNGNRSVQLTIRDGSYSYIKLSEDQCLDLINTLWKRLTGKWTATGDEAFPPKIIDEKGEIIGEEW
jgi:hypothetical protein